MRFARMNILWGMFNPQPEVICLTWQAAYNEKPKCKQKQKKEIITCLVKLGIEGKYRQVSSRKLNNEIIVSIICI